MKAFQVSLAIIFSLLLFLIGCKGNQMDAIALQSSTNESIDSLKDNTLVVNPDTNSIDTAGPAFNKVKLIYLK